MARHVPSEPPIVRGHYREIPMPLSHRMVVAGLAIVLLFAGYAQCGEVPHEGGPDGSAEVSR